MVTYFFFLSEDFAFFLDPFFELFGLLEDVDSVFVAEVPVCELVDPAWRVCELSSELDGPASFVVECWLDLGHGAASGQ